MRSILTLVLTLAVCGCIGCAAPSPRGAADVPIAALDLLERRDPVTRWDRRSLLRADLDHDGGEDFAVGGVREDRYVVAIVHGPVSLDSPVWTLDFPWDGSEDALCSKRAKITLESLAENEGPEEDQPRTGQGVNLSDDQCDAFHIYWNPRRKGFDWWRL